MIGDAMVQAKEKSSSTVTVREHPLRTGTPTRTMIGSICTPGGGDSSLCRPVEQSDSFRQSRDFALRGEISKACLLWGASCGIDRAAVRAQEFLSELKNFRVNFGRSFLEFSNRQPGRLHVLVNE